MIDDGHLLAYSSEASALNSGTKAPSGILSVVKDLKKVSWDIVGHQRPQVLRVQYSGERSI